MVRARWKGPFIYQNNIAELDSLKKNYNKLRTSRNCEIVPKFVGLNCKIHDGKNFIEVLVTEEMIGHKFGEFVLTRNKVSLKRKK